MVRNVLLPVLCVLICCGESPTPDLIFYNGTIITMSSKAESGSTEAILVRNGKIHYVGSQKEAFAQARTNAKSIDLQGATLLPGFVAPHTHPELSAYLHTFVDLSGFRHSSPEEVMSALKRAVEDAEPGEWIYCKGFDPILVPGLEKPDISQLDAMAPDNPVVILAQSMHSAWANSRAFAELGITANTKPPEQGSYYEVDADGNLTGFIVEVAAMQPFMKAALPTIDIKENFQEILDGYADHGITSIGTAGVFGENDRSLMLMRWLSAEEPGMFLNLLGFFGILPERKPTVRNFVYLKADSPFDIPSEPQRDDPSFQIIGIKLWYDGSPYTGSMYLKEPYLESDLMQNGLGLPPGNSGSPVVARDEFETLVTKFHNQGWQLAIHSQGDQSSYEVMQTLEKVLLENPRQDHRHRLEHALLLPQDLLSKLAQNGITVSFHINHLYYYGEALRNDIIGDRAESMLPTRSAFSSGIKVSLHADQPMYPEDPLSLVQTAVNRSGREGEIIGESESIDIRQALEAVTIHGAWQLGLEDRLGSIEVGKDADLVILDANPLITQPSLLRKIQVLATFVSGRQIAGTPLH